MCDKSVSSVVTLNTTLSTSALVKENSDLIGDLLLTVQNLLAGIASVSHSNLCDNCLEYRINISANFPLVTLHYQLCPNHIDSQSCSCTSHGKAYAYKDSEKLEKIVSSPPHRASLENSNEHHFLTPCTTSKNLCKHLEQSHSYSPSKTLPNHENHCLNLKKNEMQHDNIFVKKEVPELIKVLNCKESDKGRKLDEENRVDYSSPRTKPHLHHFVQNVEKDNEDSPHRPTDNFHASLSKKLSDSNDSSISEKNFFELTTSCSDSEINCMNDKEEDTHGDMSEDGFSVRRIKSDDSENKSSCMYSNPNKTLKPIYYKNFSHKSGDGSGYKISEELVKYRKESESGQAISSGQEKDGFHEVVCLPVVAILNDQDHEQNAHSSVSTYPTLADCNKVFKTESGPVPEKIFECEHSDKPFQCEYCPKAFNLLKVKLRHEKIHTGGKPYGCSYCKKCFNRKTSKEEHEKIHTGETPFPCTYCEKSFVSLHRRAQHEKIHTGEKPYLCGFCDKSFISLHRKSEHERIHTGEKPFSCGYCDKLFARIADKKQHERTHTGEKPYSCNYCEKSFTSITTKSKHERIHTDDRPFVCSYCGKSFITVSDKKQHEMIHTGVRPYSCSYCQKSFITMREKKQHERTHTGERPHLCTYCQKPFISLREQKQHERTHTGEKPYSCSFCEKSFTSSSAKSKHERTHTGERLYSCSYCGKSFINVGDRNQHERIHTGERPFRCNYCPKSFISVREQKQHERTHTGEKPYSCSICGNAFTSVSAKRKHEKNHLNEKPPPGEPEEITLI